VRWVTELQNYNFILQHKPGNLLRRADALSQQPNTYKGENDNEKTVLLKEEMFQINYQQILLDLEEEIQQQQKATEKEVESSLEREELGQQWKIEHRFVTTLRVNSGCNERQRLEGDKAKSKLVKRKEYRVLLRYL
jgi:hypothetical protein